VLNLLTGLGSDWDKTPNIVRWIMIEVGVLHLAALLLLAWFCIQLNGPPVIVDIMDGVLGCALIAGGVFAMKGIVMLLARLPVRMAGFAVGLVILAACLLTTLVAIFEPASSTVLLCMLVGVLGGPLIAGVVIEVKRIVAWTVRLWQENRASARLKALIRDGDGGHVWRGDEP
jgi:hypothetical protein